MINATAATWATFTPKFSLATTYEPPARVYTITTSRYERVTNSSTTMTAKVIGSRRLKAATPTAFTSSKRISSVPYAVDEMQSGASTPSAVGLPSRSTDRRSVTRGGPSSAVFRRYESDSGRMTTSPNSWRLNPGSAPPSLSEDAGGGCTCPTEGSPKSSVVPPGTNIEPTLSPPNATKEPPWGAGSQYRASGRQAGVVVKRT